MGRVNKALPLLSILVVAVTCYGATWVLPGKGSHAAAGGPSVTIDTSVLGYSGAGGATTFAITIGNNTNRVLYVCSGTGNVSGVDDTVSVSSNVDGAFTEMGQATDGNYVNAQIWRLVNPTVGAHTITVALAAQQLEGGMAISLYNVDQTTPNGTVVTASSSGSGPATASVTLASTSLAVGFLSTDSGSGVAVTAGVQRQEVENVGSDITFSLATNTGTGSTAVTWSLSDPGWAVVVVPVNATP